MIIIADIKIKNLNVRISEFEDIIFDFYEKKIFLNSTFFGVFFEWINDEILIHKVFLYLKAILFV